MWEKEKKTYVSKRERKSDAQDREKNHIACGILVRSWHLMCRDGFLFGYIKKIT